MLEAIVSMDTGLLNLIQEHLRCEFLDTVMPWITAWGNYGALWLFLGFALLVFPKTRKAGFLVILSVAITAFVGNLVIKPIIGRIRPFEGVMIELLIPMPHGLSFPSGHSATSFAAAVVLYRVLGWKWGIPSLIAATLVAFSRMYLYVHYFTDVFAGAVLGIAVSFLLLFLFKRWENRHENSPSA